MSLDPAKVAGYAIPPASESYTARDCMLYALGLGLGHEPVDRGQLAFVYEEMGPKVLPTMVSVIGDPNHWMGDAEFGLGDLPNVHGDQTIELHAPIQPDGEVTGQSKVVGLYDRGPGSHAIMIVEEELTDSRSGKPLATLRQTDVLIGGGGFGGEPPPKSERPAMPDRGPDHMVDHPTAPEAALLYRLSGDHYELHVEPVFARQAGFDGPILHGLATYGIACYAVVATCCDHDPDRIASFHGRFTAPVYPGETLRTHLWRDGAAVRFETRVVERDVVVLANGRADLRTER